MSRFLPILLGIVVIAIGTYVQGEYSDRWRQEYSQQLLTFADRVPLVPREIGDWVSLEEDDTVISPEEWAATNCVAYLSRHYKNSDGQVVSMYLVAGSGRHITIHSPDQCFVGAGFEMENRPRQCLVSLRDGQHDNAEFATTTFLREDATKSEHLRTLWSYSDEGHWEGPAWAKSEYGAIDAMYKVYLTTNVDQLHGNSDPLESANAAFARELMPVLTEVLFVPGEETTPAAPEE